MQSLYRADPERIKARVKEYRTREPLAVLEKRKSANRKRAREAYQRATFGFILKDPSQLLTVSKDRFRTARALGFRSGLEVAIARQLEQVGVPVLYEAAKIHYVWPASNCTYTPDYILPNGIVVESKGLFLTEDRQKSKHIKAQHPNLDLRFVFSNARARLTKVSKTTYAAWCDTYGFPWADKIIPAAWIAEPPSKERFEALRAATKGAFLGNA